MSGEKFLDNRKIISTKVFIINGNPSTRTKRKGQESPQDMGAMSTRRRHLSAWRDGEGHGERERERDAIADKDSLMRYFLIGITIGFAISTLLASCWKGLIWQTFSSSFAHGFFIAWITIEWTKEIRDNNNMGMVILGMAIGVIVTALVSVLLFTAWCIDFFDRR